MFDPGNKFKKSTEESTVVKRQAQKDMNRHKVMCNLLPAKFFIVQQRF